MLHCLGLTLAAVVADRVELVRHNATAAIVNAELIILCGMGCFDWCKVNEDWMMQ